MTANDQAAGASETPLPWGVRAGSGASDDPLHLRVLRGRLPGTRHLRPQQRQAGDADGRAHRGASAPATAGPRRAFAFQTDRGKPQVQEFRNVLERRLSGDRIGQATDIFNMRWSVLGADLQMLVEEHQVNEVPAPSLANRWVARDDARNYLILGDPAVRLRVEAMA